MTLNANELEHNAVSLLELWLTQAITLQASDLHFEPTAEGLRLRLRRDGLLITHAQASRALRDAVVSRLKILARMDIAEKRLPQDGRLRHRHDARDYDLRISSIPTIHGEKLVVRVLQHEQRHASFEQLGLEPLAIDQLTHALAQPHGLILFTGPTGSGKTRSLYSCLDQLNDQHLNISTVEDPCEIQLPGINQVNVHDKAGFGFAQALRALLRQDPDVLMIGEIRDAATAHIATQAAQTGHRVLSTLHTPDTVSSITRLQHMGIERFNIASTLNLIVAQRLVRRLCDHCKQACEHLGQPVYKAIGCALCIKGYQGRIGIFELLMVDDPLRNLILDAEHETRLKQQAIQNGLITLRQAAWNKVLQGLTSPEEMYAHTSAG